jgi:hypothetical protein
MENSPVKKIDFEALGKENILDSTLVVDATEIKMPLTQPIKPAEKSLGKPLAVSVAPTIKPEESDEPLLQENPHRFVLFPIRYHEVGVLIMSRHALNGFRWTELTRHCRSGKCTKRPRHHSGPPRRLIFPKIFMTGTIV